MAGSPTGAVRLTAPQRRRRTCAGVRQPPPQPLPLLRPHRSSSSPPLTLLVSSPPGTATTPRTPTPRRRATTTASGPGLATMSTRVAGAPTGAARLTARRRRRRARCRCCCSPRKRWTLLFRPLPPPAMLSFRLTASRLTCSRIACRNARRRVTGASKRTGIGAATICKEEDDYYKHISVAGDGSDRRMACV